MNISKYIDSKNTFYDQKRFVTSFIFYGMPIGYVIGQIFSILLSGWEKYNFNIFTLIFVFTIDIIIFSPFIYNYFKHNKRFNKFIIKHQKNSIKEIRIKALFNYRNFIKDEFYSFTILDLDATKLTSTNWSKINFKYNSVYLYVEDHRNHDIYDLKEIVNKFQLDDIKEERLRKLKKLKSLW